MRTSGCTVRRARRHADDDLLAAAGGAADPLSHTRAIRRHQLDLLPAKALADLRHHAHDWPLTIRMHPRLPTSVIIGEAAARMSELAKLITFAFAMLAMLGDRAQAILAQAIVKTGSSRR